MGVILLDHFLLISLPEFRFPAVLSVILVPFPVALSHLPIYANQVMPAASITFAAEPVFEFIGDFFQFLPRPLREEMPLSQYT